MSRRGSLAWIRHVESGVAIAATAILLGFHYVFLQNAGALWRDEIDSVNLASLSSFPEIWANLQYHSFPALWFVLLRVWILAGPGGEDPGIRVLGFLVGLGILAVLWRNARTFGHSVPLVALALLGFNSAVIIYGDSIRGHGLGMLAGILTLGLIWEAAKTPRLWRVGLATLAALVAVQCLYYNVVFVLAACAGGLAVTLSRRRSWRSVGPMLVIGAVSAASLLPYTRVMQERRSDDTFRTSVNPSLISGKVEEAFASTGGTILWVWIGLVTLAVVAVVYALLSRAGSGIPEKSQAALFCGVAILTGIPTYFVFLKALGFLTQPWYYVAMMALVAACLDAPLMLLVQSDAVRGARLVIVVVVIALTMQPVWKAVHVRNTNVDLVAARVGESAVESDLIVVNPWYVGLTFHRYYDGRAAWMTVPPLPPLQFQRYDLLREKMMTRGAMAPVLDEMQRALQEGHRVFWVGDLFLPEQGEVPADPPPAPNAPWGWADGPYYYHWALQAAYLVQSHARAAEKLEIPVRQAVNEYENAGLYVFSGWWEGNAAR